MACILSQPKNIRRNAAIATCLFFGLFCAIPNTVYGSDLRGEYWQGSESCEALFESPLPILPGGSHLTAIMGERSVQAHYVLATGGKLRLTVRDVGKAPVKGKTYADAYTDLLERRPLQDRISRKVDNNVVLANVRNLIGVGYHLIPVPDESAYQVKPDSLRLTLTAKVRVADWQGYALASRASQQSWDNHSCISYHHELGHILVAAQLLEASQTEWLNMRSQTEEELEQKLRFLMDDIGDRIKDRQNVYHDELEEMGPELGESRPYLELPFTWLQDSPSP